MDLAKYVGLLSRGLFFARPSTFSDAWEGCWSEADVLAFKSANRGADAALLNTKWSESYRAKTQQLETLGINCWHQNEEESYALWGLYMPRGMGVAIRSSVKRVLGALAKADRIIHVCEVRYERVTAVMMDGLPIELLSRKRPEFAHERELRFVTTLRNDELSAIESLEEMLNDRQHRHASTADGPLIRVGRAYGSFDKSLVRRTAPGGVHLPTDLSVLIEEVRLGRDVSYPVRRAVIDATVTFGLDARLIKEGPTHQAPPDQIIFHD